MQQNDVANYIDIFKYIDNYEVNGHKLNKITFNFVNGTYIETVEDTFTLYHLREDGIIFLIEDLEIDNVIKLANKLELESIRGSINKDAISTEFTIDQFDDDENYYLIFNIDNLDLYDEDINELNVMFNKIN